MATWLQVDAIYLVKCIDAKVDHHAEVAPSKHPSE